ncbi:MAG: outer membrane lipid asymmetry maintenance protein MlaD [Pseudomonadota bacterium]
MKSTHQIEWAAGVFLLLGIAALIFLALQATNGGRFSGGTYQLMADFSNVGSLKPRAPVNLGGVRIGSVESIELDPISFNARVTLAINTEYDQLPDDSSAAILTSGLLGDQYIGIEPGGSPDVLGNGDRVLITSSAVVLEQLINRYLLNNTGDEN